jgi:hypothetical protein
MTTQPTTSQLATLRNEAAVRGDYRMACICTLAINGFLSTGPDDDGDDPGAFEGAKLEAEGKTQEQAIAECAAANDAAESQDDE